MKKLILIFISLFREDNLFFMSLFREDMLNLAMDDYGKRKRRRIEKEHGLILGICLCMNIGGESIFYGKGKVLILFVYYQSLTSTYNYLFKILNLDLSLGLHKIIY